MNDDITGLIQYVDTFQVIKKDDMKFLAEHSEHFGKVFERSHIWRTDVEKEMIISDENHATDHSKFHQATAEQKVQLDQAFYLAKEFEMKKLEIEELEYDIRELTKTNPDGRQQLTIRKKNIELKFKMYELKHMEIAMDYRIKEVRGWQRIEERLLERMTEAGMDEGLIWSKNDGEIESMFFESLMRLHGIKQTTDAGSYHNLVSHAKFALRQAKEAGIYDRLLARCNDWHKNALKMLGEMK